MVYINDLIYYLQPENGGFKFWITYQGQRVTGWVRQRSDLREECDQILNKPGFHDDWVF